MWEVLQNQRIGLFSEEMWDELPQGVETDFTNPRRMIFKSL
jgi:hypothetical protein